MDAQAASQLLTMMNSSLRMSWVPLAPRRFGYRVGVKTGTAETVIDGTAGLSTLFTGIIPADTPRLAIAVVLYNPKVASMLI